MKLFNYATSTFGNLMSKHPTAKRLKYAQTTETYTMFDTYKKPQVSTEDHLVYLEEAKAVPLVSMFLVPLAVLPSIVLMPLLSHTGNPLIGLLFLLLAPLAAALLTTAIMWNLGGFFSSREMKKQMKRAGKQGAPVVYTPKWKSRPNDIWPFVGFTITALIVGVILFG